MQKSVNQKQQSLFSHVPLLNNQTSLGKAAIRSMTPNRLHQVPDARINVKMSAANMHKAPTFGGQAVQVPPLQVDDLLDFNFPLKTSIREAHVNKWTNPKTGQLYNWQQPATPAQGYKGDALDQMLDWKYTQGKGLQQPANNTMQGISAEQAKFDIKNNMKQWADNLRKRSPIPSMRVGVSGMSADLYPPNYQKQVPNGAPVVSNLMSGDNAKGLIENYIDSFEVFKN